MSKELVFAGISAVIGLASFVAFVVVLVKMVRQKGCLLGILGFFIPLVAFVWGWIKAKELEITDIMLFWTFMIILSTIVSVVGLLSGMVQDPEMLELLNTIEAGGL
jgi:hypothetical protein